MSIAWYYPYPRIHCVYTFFRTIDPPRIMLIYSRSYCIYICVIDINFDIFKHSSLTIYQATAMSPFPVGFPLHVCNYNIIMTIYVPWEAFHDCLSEIHSSILHCLNFFPNKKISLRYIGVCFFNMNVVNMHPK